MARIYGAIITFGNGDTLKIRRFADLEKLLYLDDKKVDRRCIVNVELLVTKSK